MGKIAQELGAVQVRNLKGEGLHFVGGVPGLALCITGTARSWILRVAVNGKRREMGLGPFPEVGLADAREAARAARVSIRAGVDPVAQRREARRVVMTFDEAATAYITAHRAGWRNEKHADQWRATLTTYASPLVGRLPVADVGTAHVRSILEPIWRNKTETATRVRGRIEAVLDWAVVAGHRPEGLNPARWKGHLALMLPAPRKVTKVEHHAALPWIEMPASWLRLRVAPGMGARALEFAILTAARSGEVRGATWAEIDLAAKVWTVPAERMKAGREHRVPLSPAACDVLAKLDAVGALVFPSSKDEKPLSDMTLSAVLRRLKVHAVPHGFRSTFRDWAAENTGHPRDVCEMALAHAVGDKVEAAYRRGDLFEKRRALMTDWAEFVASSN